MSASTQKFSNPAWLKEHGFSALAEISQLLEDKENEGRDALIRTLEFRDLLRAYDPIISALIQRAGLYPYLEDEDGLSTGDLVNLEYHSPQGLDDIVLHSAQAKVYRALMDGANVILSAPTSFGKSLLIDAVIASQRFTTIVVIVPTIALIDETRRRLVRRFGNQFKVVTHPSQEGADRNIYVLTQERFVEFGGRIKPSFFVLDEFYKLSPERGDERTFVLNQAFYQLFKSGAQFFLIGPNVQDITINESDLNFRFFRFNFATVATEIRYGSKTSPMDNALDICSKLLDPTLIFCRSSVSAYKLAKALIEAKISAPNPRAKELAEWLRVNYHPEWILPSLLDHGFAVHHGSLPRSIAFHLLRMFNEGAIRFLLCTSTIIEGVNTSAKNIIIYDNKIGVPKFDQFDFNNIKGRAGRMLKHFVGHVYVLHPEPDPELPIVDIPSVTQSEGAPESLLIQMDSGDLSERSSEQLRYLHAQDILPVEIMRQSSGIEPRHQLDLATEITTNPGRYHPLLSWSGMPTGPQLAEVGQLIFKYFLGGRGKDGVFTPKQLSFQLWRFIHAGSIPALIQEEVDNPNSEGESEAVESVLRFLRQWCEFHFPRFLSSLDRIQRSVFERLKMEPGDYQAFAYSVKHLFMHPAVTILEEYGLPYKITLLVLEKYDLGNEVDEIITNLHKVDPAKLGLSRLETEMLRDTIENI